MNTPRTEPRPVLPRVSGAAVTGAVLATGAATYLSWVRQHDDRACATTDSICVTWRGVTAIPLTMTIAVIVLTVVYKRLDIRPRIAVIPPTFLLAPLPLAAAQATAGWWAATLVGGAWSGSFALAAWSRYRILGLTASATLLLVSLVVLYR
ncbi:hypothetical protein AQI88_23440 [Streptomyces cellostaticus]|uniref:Uncharacterized protein n=1 Tax=Streptomyces cellostaticus TaxID=67285 RepID=A0A117PVI1_9ACTN|nr:hypothetical protein [Streptomyces cellostaticus]KUM94115.1 hypothetical protein AQI88_23440 [Streptomyces cellostaticus]GHI05272.1 hypothetical protein Scel_35930 [Streptomyces cellostaticus]